ncbi:MAG: hypothetical protein FD127_662 [Acidimicrobiaceae bacterium]|nr:MAG: hypothetical protein FD127_662 [Acidimicrobiaceae bacterium]
MSNDPFEVLVAHLREVAACLEPTQTDDDVIAYALAHGSRTAVRPRRRVWTAGVVAAVVLLVGSGAAAAIVAMRDGGRPEAGVVCRSAANLQSSARVIPLGDDPIADCVALWVAGELPRVGQVNAKGSSPALIACAVDDRSIEVLPVTDDATCSSIGLDEANIVALVTDPLVILNERLIAEVNPACLSAEAAPDVVRSILADLSIEGWSVVVRPGDGECVRAGLDDATPTVFLFPGPPPEG